MLTPNRLHPDKAHSQLWWVFGWGVLALFTRPTFLQIEPAGTLALHVTCLVGLGWSLIAGRLSTVWATIPLVAGLAILATSILRWMGRIAKFASIGPDTTFFEATRWAVRAPLNVAAKFWNEGAYLASFEVIGFEFLMPIIVVVLCFSIWRKSCGR